MKRQFFGLIFLLCAVVTVQSYLLQRSQASVLKADVNETMEFRRQELSKSVAERLEEQSKGDGHRFARMLTNAMLKSGFRAVDKDLEDSFFADEVYLKYKQEEYQSLLKSYEAIWADLECFPVKAKGCTFEDSFGEPRTYGGDRIHEGTDIFAEEEISGYYPVVSMTDGVVEQVGWLPLGGYRIGIRSPGGGYFYYAHLSSYDREFQKGEAVQAGEILGFMGNTGYGPKGTKGKFPVHLHLGIYIVTRHHAEQSVDPYAVLQMLQN
ncbi:MAG: M23 family metallopeptidase [Blautia sp.]